MSLRRVALLLAIAAALWDGYWLVRALILSVQRPLSGLETALFSALTAAHALSLAAFMIRGALWTGVILVLCAAAVARCGFYYFYVVWPGAAMLAVSAAAAWLARAQAPG